MSLQKQLEYNKGLFMDRVPNNEAPEYISNLYTHTPSRYSNSWHYQLSLPRPRMDIFKTSISFSAAFLDATTYLWQPDLGSHSSPSSENFEHTLKQLHRMDCDITLLGRETDSEVFEWLPLQRLVIWDLLYTPAELRPVLPTACESVSLPPPPPHPTLLYCSVWDKYRLLFYSFPILVIWTDQMFYCFIYWLYAHNV